MVGYILCGHVVAVAFGSYSYLDLQKVSIISSKFGIVRQDRYSKKQTPMQKNLNYAQRQHQSLMLLIMNGEM